MTSESNESQFDQIGQRANQWIDAEANDPEYTDAFELQDGQQLCFAADIQLVHAMLMGLAENNKHARPRRVNKLMHSIRADVEERARGKATSSQKSRRYVGPAIKWGTAAMIIISLTIFLTSLPSNKAMATMDQMIAAIEKAGDRTYSIIVRDQKTRRRERTGRPPIERRNRRERAVFDGATLYLRGKDKYVLYRYTPSGQTVVNGSNGKTNWLIRPRREVLVSNDTQAFRIPMPEDLAGLLTLNFGDTLQRIRERYRIKYLGTVPVEQDKETSWAYLHATQPNRRFRGPRVIRIWAHPDTGLLRRIEFADIRLQGDPDPKKLILDLVDQRQLPNDWFTHSAHHPPDAEVDSLSE